MNATAVICELNPLHRGHKYVFSEAKREADCLIAIMSGNFVQRAEPAVLDKYERARLAIAAGADLVLELPFPYCCGSAEFFASASTYIVDAVGADRLAFGVSCKDLSLLRRVASAMMDPTFSANVIKMSYDHPEKGTAQVREECLKLVLGDDADKVMHSPNDVLAIEYLKSIERFRYRISPMAIPRISSLDDPDFKGATDIRALIDSGGVATVKHNVPPETFAALEEAVSDGSYASVSTFRKLAFLHMRMNRTPRGDVADGGNGLVLRIYDAACKATSPEEMLQIAATKKYTNARIRRVLLYSMLGVGESALRRPPAATTLLAANKTGRQYLSHIRKKCSLPIVTKPADYRDLPEEIAGQYSYTLSADQLYTLCQTKIESADYFVKQHPFMA